MRFRCNRQASNHVVVDIYGTAAAGIISLGGDAHKFDAVASRDIAPKARVDRRLWLSGDFVS